MTSRLPMGLAVVLVFGTATSLLANADAPRTIEIRQDELDPEDRLAPRVLERIGRVLLANESLLGAPPIDFCRKLRGEDRKRCVEAVSSIARSEIDGVVAVEENARLKNGGREWPNSQAVSNFLRLRLSVPLRKQGHSTEHEASVVVFRSRRGDRADTCVFPLEHWSWSAMDRPERFAQPPVGVCGDRTLTVAQYLVEQAPDAAPVVLRFLSEPEARAWQAGDPERIKWDSPYTSGHPYAKYFLLDSLRWWRGGAPPARRKGYAWAVRFEHLPLAKIRALEESGDVFLDVFEDAEQIELTNVTRAGLVALLAERPEVLIDTSGPNDTAPRFAPLPPPREPEDRDASPPA